MATYDVWVMHDNASKELAESFCVAEDFSKIAKVCCGDVVVISEWLLRMVMLAPTGKVMPFVVSHPKQGAWTLREVLAEAQRCYLEVLAGPEGDGTDAQDTWITEVTVEKNGEVVISIAD